MNSKNMVLAIGLLAGLGLNPVGINAHQYTRVQLGVGLLLSAVVMGWLYKTWSSSYTHSTKRPSPKAPRKALKKPKDSNGTNNKPAPSNSSNGADKGQGKKLPVYSIDAKDLWGSTLNILKRIRDNCCNDLYKGKFSEEEWKQICTKYGESSTAYQSNQKNTTAALLANKEAREWQIHLYGQTNNSAGKIQGCLEHYLKVLKYFKISGNLSDGINKYAKAMDLRKESNQVFEDWKAFKARVDAAIAPLSKSKQVDNHGTIFQESQKSWNVVDNELKGSCPEPRSLPVKPRAYQEIKDLQPLVLGIMKSLNVCNSYNLLSFQSKKKFDSLFNKFAYDKELCKDKTLALLVYKRALEWQIDLSADHRYHRIKKCLELYIDIFSEIKIADKLKLNIEQYVKEMKYVESDENNAKIFKDWEGFRTKVNTELLNNAGVDQKISGYVIE